MKNTPFQEFEKTENISLQSLPSAIELGDLVTGNLSIGNQKLVIENAKKRAVGILRRLNDGPKENTEILLDTGEKQFFVTKKAITEITDTLTEYNLFTVHDDSIFDASGMFGLKRVKGDRRNTVTDRESDLLKNFTGEITKAILSKKGYNVISKNSRMDNFEVSPKLN